MNNSTGSEVQKPLVLIVDDDKVILNNFKQMLEFAGFDTVTATEYYQAKQLLHGHTFDTVLLDIFLGQQKNGLDLLRKSLEIQPETPVILVTGAPTVKSASDALRMGAYDYLCKPVIYETLLNVINRAVDLKKLRLDKKRIETENLNYQKDLEILVKKRARKLREQNTFLKSVLESFTHPFLVIDADSYAVKIANNAAKRENIMEGLTCHEQIHGKAHPCDGDETYCTVKAVKKRKMSVQLNHVHHRSKEEDPVECELHGFPVLDATGKVTEVIQCHFDITEREKTRRELNRLKIAIEQSGDSVVITDPEGIIQYVNPTFESVTGYSREEVLEKYLDILKCDLNEAAYQEMWNTIRQGRVWHGGFTNKKKDGTLFEEESTFSPVKDENGEVLNYVAIKRDVTEKKRLESVAEASNLMDNLGYIFSGLRHEIGNPINSIKMTLTVLRNNLKNYSEATVMEFVNRSLSELARVEYLLKSLKNFSLFERPHIQDVAMDGFMEKFLSLVKDDFKRKGIHIEAKTTTPAGVGATDVRALHQVMLNLLTNAADALEGREKPEITVSLKKSRGLIKIQIKDNGKGMTEMEKENLFRPFFTSKPHGTGLGLVIVKNMLSKMNSSIKIESRENIGTTVTVSIPEGKRGNP